MRKLLLLITSLLVAVVSLNAQKLQSSTKKETSLKQQRVNAPVDIQTKIDPQLKSNVKLDTRPGLTTNAKKLGTVKTDANKPTTATNASAKVPVEIKCMVTPALVQVITSSGGEIVKSSSTDNSITANVPVAALNKIASSTDVKYIAKASTAIGLINSTKPVSAAAKAPVVVSPAVDVLSPSTISKNKIKAQAN